MHSLDTDNSCTIPRAASVRKFVVTLANFENNALADPGKSAPELEKGAAFGFGEKEITVSICHVSDAGFRDS